MGDSTDLPIHAFASYNKKTTPVTLIGNWQEERALKETTGTSRYEPWVEPGEPQTIYTPRQDHASEMPTFPRVIEHIEQTPAQNWQSMQQISFQDPKRTTRLQEYSRAPGCGPRELQELDLLRAVAAELPPEVEATLTGHPIPHQLETTQRADYVEKDLTVNTVGAHVMKDRDGRPAVRDPTFLAETQLVPRQLADRVFGEAAVAAGAAQTVVLPNPDVPITLYSEAVAARKYTGSVYGTRPIVGSNPFGKATNFTKPMSEYNKIVVDE